MKNLLCLTLFSVRYKQSSAAVLFGLVDNNTFTTQVDDLIIDK